MCPHGRGHQRPKLHWAERCQQSRGGEHQGDRITVSSPAWAHPGKAWTCWGKSSKDP